jgi:hypothetical protein
MLRNRPAANRAAIHIFKDALTTPANTTAEPETLQARRLAKPFFLSPEIAATIARLHFGEARA